MEVTIWLQLIGLGLVCGLIGQALRVLVGLKKMGKDKDANALGLKRPTIPFNGGRLLVSLLIGAIAGSLAAIMTISNVEEVSSQEILGLAAAGYAGADFIEGVLKSFLAPGQSQGLEPASGSG